jgi:FMN reductase
VSAHVIFVTSSPSTKSRSSFLADFVEKQVRAAGHRATAFAVTDFDAADLILGRSDSPAVAAFVQGVKAADAVVVATPVYKATYSGALKAVVDLVPPDALEGKLALGIATTRLGDHAAGVDAAYRSLFAFFRARALNPLVVLDRELATGRAGFTFEDTGRARVDRTVEALLAALLV